jgi:hypothetical protein
MQLGGQHARGKIIVSADVHIATPRAGAMQEHSRVPQHPAGFFLLCSLGIVYVYTYTRASSV